MTQSELNEIDNYVTSYTVEGGGFVQVRINDYTRLKQAALTPEPENKIMKCPNCKEEVTYFSQHIHDRVNQPTSYSCKPEPEKPMNLTLSGATLITNERNRQIVKEGWTFAHDDNHEYGEMARAAEAYLTAQAWLNRKRVKPSQPACWPWAKCWWKPSTDPVRNLVKAGALIAAEIDRLQRLREKGEPL